MSEASNSFVWPAVESEVEVAAGGSSRRQQAAAGGSRAGKSFEASGKSFEAAGKSFEASGKSFEVQASGRGQRQARASFSWPGISFFSIAHAYTSDQIRRVSDPIGQSDVTVPVF